MKNNYISFSLWGNKNVYTIGALRNAELALSVYVDWKVIIYHDDTVPAEILRKLEALGVILKDMTNSDIYGPFWRFLALDIPDAGFVVFRDTDSRLSLREKAAVDEWIKDDNILHVMRDHPAHHIPFGATGLSILAGMWGMKAGEFEMADDIRKFCMGKSDYYGIDQTFLEDVYIRFKHSMTVHDEFFEKIPFPLKRKGYRFVGERIDENEQPVGADWIQIKRYNEAHHPTLLNRIKRFFK